jgi:acyl-CoA synthetase (AMP-forming)/AMP-acid ligase II
VNGPTTFNFADLWEAVAAAVPGRVAVVRDPTRRSYGELDRRASRLAAWMAGRGVGRGDFVAVDLRNSVEYVETMLAAYKLRAVPVNVNYRFLAGELRTLFGDGPVVGVVAEPDLADRVTEAAAAVPSIGWTLWRGADYEQAIDDAGGEVRGIPRSGDDDYVLYTGGTTDRPKGVVWRMEDAFFACLGGGDPTGEQGPVTEPGEVLDRLVDSFAFLPAAPLMHAAGLWTTLRWLLAGATVVLLPRFDGRAVWRAVAAERVNLMNIVGDAMARPLLDALDPGGRRRLTGLRTIASGGAPLSEAAKVALTGTLPWLTVKDAYGSSETGVQAWAMFRAGDDPAPRFRSVDTVILDPSTLVPLPPGSTASGVVARRGRVPLRYHRDPARTAAAFFVRDGERYALTGDLGRMDADGTLVVFGRGSQCINSGGEKVHPEEVEAVVRSHPDVYDAVVVGAPDPIWGQQVVALIQPVNGRAGDEEEIRGHCRASLAAYKVPKRVVTVDRVVRSPAGKPDYRWAASAARAGLETEGARP